MITKLKQRHSALLQKLAEQSSYIDRKVDDWKFSYPELALYIETKKRTLEKTLHVVTQALEKPDATEQLELLNKKLDDVESLFASLQQDFKPRWRKVFELSTLAFLAIFFLYSSMFKVYCVTSSSCEPALLLGDRVLINKMVLEYSDVKRGDLIIFDMPDIPYEQKWSVKYIWQRFVGFKFEPLDLPEGPAQTIRRVIALPGDTIEGKIENGEPVLYLNGDKLDDSNVNPYPLIASHRRKETLETSHLAARFLPSSLVRQSNPQPTMWTTHVPNTPHEKQPFYKLSKEEILINPKTGRPSFKTPKIPEYYDVFGPLELPEGKYWCLGDNRRNSIDSRTWGALDESLIRGRAHAILYSIDTQESTWVFDVIKDPVAFCSKKLRTDRFLKKLGSA